MVIEGQTGISLSVQGLGKFFQMSIFWKCLSICIHTKIKY